MPRTAAGAITRTAAEGPRAPVAPSGGPGLRTTPVPHVDEAFAGEVSNRYAISRCAGNVTVATSFPRYGGGAQRQSDFSVEVTWADVEKILETFCKANHPEAVALGEARKLQTS